MNKTPTTNHLAILASLAGPTLGGCVLEEENDNLPDNTVNLG